MFKAIISVIFLVSFSVAKANPKGISDNPVFKSFSNQLQATAVKAQPEFVKNCQKMFPDFHQYKLRAACYGLLGFQAALQQFSKRK